MTKTWIFKDYAEKIVGGNHDQFKPQVIALASE
jgi:hypothetical protein